MCSLNDVYNKWCYLRSSILLSSNQSFHLHTTYGSNIVLQPFPQFITKLAPNTWRAAVNFKNSKQTSRWFFIHPCILPSLHLSIIQSSQPRFLSSFHSSLFLSFYTPLELPFVLLHFLYSPPTFFVLLPICFSFLILLRDKTECN
jgi:hypothetical protein